MCGKRDYEEYGGCRAAERTFDPAPRELGVEKDFWVCWLLGIPFESDIADSVVFKGGTSATGWVTPGEAVDSECT